MAVVARAGEKRVALARGAAEWAEEAARVVVATVVVATVVVPRVVVARVVAQVVGTVVVGCTQAALPGQPSFDVAVDVLRRQAAAAAHEDILAGARAAIRRGDATPGALSRGESALVTRHLLLSMR